MKRTFRKPALILSAAAVVLPFILSSCITGIILLATKDKDDNGKMGKDSLVVKEFIDQMMNGYYYWEDQMPSSVSKKNISVEKYFSSKLITKDRWSWMMNRESYLSMSTGISTSYGFHLSQPIEYYKSYQVFISYVDKNSPLAVAGVTRGYELTHIAGTDVPTLIKNNSFYSEIAKQSNRFTFKSTSGESVELNLRQTTFVSNSVTLTKTYTQADAAILQPTDKVGYILYTMFNLNMKNEILNTLQQMKQQGVTDLIIDLRYNGGGDLSVCHDIANLLAPASADGKLFLKLSHNKQQQHTDTEYTIKRNGNSLNLNRLFIITGSGTASSSECIINCLSPYMNILTIGSKTYGKPNGMYVFLYPQHVADSQIDYAFMPVSFYCLNANGKADYDNGITPQEYRYDDLFHDFSPQEDLIGACLSYIGTGFYPPLPAVSTTKANLSAGQKIEFKESFKGAYLRK